jgi:hypothetical protein
MRSAETISRRSAIERTDASSSSVGVSSNDEMNRAARIIRSGSSEKDTSGSTGVRRTLPARSATPSNGSINVGSSEVTSRAIALIVKSRRDRSASISVAKSTCGLRLSGRYTSARWVVIS